MRLGKRAFSLILTTTLTVSTLVGLAGVASAATDNSIDRVPSISTTFTGRTATLTIKETNLTDFVAGDTFRVILPSGVKWDDASLTVTGANYAKRTDQVLEVTINSPTNGPNPDTVSIGLGIKVDGASGDLELTVDPLDSPVTGGKYLFARVQSGKTVAVAESVPSIGQTGTGGKIRIDETAVGAIGTASQSITFKLPSKFTWNGMNSSDFVFAGGLAGSSVTSVTSSGSTLTLNFTPFSPRTQRGTIYVTPKIKAEAGASFGDVTVAISGDQVSDADVTVAKYVDWGVTVEVSSVKELLAGKFDGTTTDKITIKENVPGSLIAGRLIRFSLPSWVKVTQIKDFSASGGNLTATGPSIDGNGSSFDIPVTQGSTGTAGSISFKLDLSIQGDQTGDIKATITGAGIPETEVVVAKAVAPVTASAKSTDIKLGVQDQPVSDLTITELVKGAIETSPESNSSVSAEIRLTLPDGVTFAATPKVEVTKGDLELKTGEVRVVDNGKSVTIPVKSESIKPSEITVSNLRLTVDRTYPEGKVKLGIGGAAIVENSRAATGWLNGAVPVSPTGSSTTLDPGEFDKGTSYSVEIANVVTPAPAEQKKSATFVVGSTTLTVNGQEITMDVAPYIKDGRTYVPVRYAAQALGVSEDNIIWNEANQTVTLIKGLQVVQFQIGNRVMKINGIEVPMDVAPEIASNRTMLPFRYVAQALGATVQWDAIGQKVTMELN